jgi:hypothetical protein
MHSDKKIAFVIHGLPMGGAEKFMINLANNFHERGCEPVVILLSNATTLLHELNGQIKVVTILKKSRLNLSVSKRIKKTIHVEKIAKVFCINTYSFFLTKLAFLFDKKTSFYLSLHSTIPSSKKNFCKAQGITFELPKKQCYEVSCSSFRSMGCPINWRRTLW